MKCKRVVTLDCEITESLEKGDSRWNDPSKLTLSVLGIHDQLGAATTLNWYSPFDAVSEGLARDDILDFRQVQGILDRADLLITFNGERFDFPLLEGAGFNLGNVRSVSFDLMAEFVKVAGHRISLAGFAKALGGLQQLMLLNDLVEVVKAGGRFSDMLTLVRKLNFGEKHGTGSDAPKLWACARDLASLDSMTLNSESLARGVGASALYNHVIDYCLNDVELTRNCFDTLVASSGLMTYFNLTHKTDRTVRLEMPEGFRTAEAVIAQGGYDAVTNNETSDDVPF